MLHRLLLLLLLVPAAAAQTVTVDMEPTSGTAPLGVAFTVRAGPETDPSLLTTWEIRADGEAIQNGTGVPRSFNHTFLAGTYAIEAISVYDGRPKVDAAGTIQAQAPTAPPLLHSSVWPLLVAGALMIALAGYLLAKDAKNPINVAFGLLFITRGWYHITEALWYNPGTMHIRYQGFHHLLPVTAIVTFAAALWFLWQYLAQNRVDMTAGRVVAGILAWVSLVAIIVYTLYPGMWWNSLGITQDGVLVAEAGGWLFLIAGAFYPLYSVTGLLLLRESTHDIPDGRRQSAFFAGLGFMFLPAFIAFGELFYVDIWDWFGVLGIDERAFSLPFHVAHYLAILAIVPIIMALWGLGADWLRNPERAHGRGHFLGLLATLVLPILTVAIGGWVFHAGGPTPETAQASLSVYAAFQGIWAIPYPILVAYGIIRYQNEGDQMSAGRDLRRFAMTSIFFTVFFAVTEGIEAIAANRFGTWIGLGSAAALTVALNPIQDKVMKSKLVTLQGETAQELAFYKEQVRRTLDDGMMGPHERKFLQNLQKTMGITQDTARRIEAEVRRTGPQGPM